MSGADEQGPLELLVRPVPEAPDMPAELPPSDMTAPVGKRPLEELAAHADRLRRALTVSVCAVVAWSMLEAPWEIDGNSSSEEIAGVIVSKCMLCAIAAFALLGRKFARYLLLFVCLTSVLAIAPEMPAEFSHAPWLALLSSVECVTKLATFALLAWYLKVLSRIDTMRVLSQSR